MDKFVFPDFNNSNLNITSTLAEFLNCGNDKPTIKILKDELNKNYKNVIFICLDGLGMNPININLDDNSILKNNIVMELTSTFPSTTTNATTSLLTNKYPLEHGWFGWSMYFEKMNKNINIFPKTDSFDNKKIKITDSPLKRDEYYFDKANSDYKVYTIFPEYVDVKNKNNNYIFETTEGFFTTIREVLNKDSKKFIYAYYGEPDSTMHEYGVTSIEAHKLINELDDGIKSLYNEFEDTLFIITADHGQIDIEGYIDLYGDKKLMDMLVIYPYLDARAVAFKVKDGKLEEFKNYFNSKYNDDFILYESKKLIDMGVFGPKGDMGYLLGDYIAIGTFTNKTALLTPVSHKFKGHHTSLTKEMMVPLILLKKER